MSNRPQPLVVAGNLGHQHPRYRIGLASCEARPFGQLLSVGARLPQGVVGERGIVRAHGPPDQNIRSTRGNAVNFEIVLEGHLEKPAAGLHAVVVSADPPALAVDELTFGSIKPRDRRQRALWNRGRRCPRCCRDGAVYRLEGLPRATAQTRRIERKTEAQSRRTSVFCVTLSTLCAALVCTT